MTYIMLLITVLLVTGLTTITWKVLFSESNSDNLLLLSELTKYFRVEFNSAINNTFYVYDNWNNYLCFLLFKKAGLYLINVKVSEPAKTMYGYNLITVEDEL